MGFNQVLGGLLMDADVTTVTDIGIEGIRAIDLLGFGLCIVLSIFGVKMRSFAFLAVAGIGWMVVGFQVVAAVGEPSTLILVFAVAAVHFLYGMKLEKVI